MRNAPHRTGTAAAVLRAVLRHRRIARVAFAQAVRRDWQFRAQTWTTVVVGLAETVVGIVPALLVFSTTDQVGGWQVGSVLAVAGGFQVLLALLATFVQPNQAAMTDYVRRGDLDAVLIRPVSAQWYAACRWVRPAELWSGLAGLALIVVGLADAGVRPGIGEVLIGLGWFAAGYALVALVWANLGYLAFWLESSDPVGELMLVLLSAGRYPVTFFPSAVRTAMLFVVPVGVATTLPVSALSAEADSVPVGIAGADAVLPVLATLALLVVLTRVHWMLARRRYASASS